MGAILGCRKAGLAMAAGMSLGRSPFLRVDSPSRNRSEDDERTAAAEMKNQRILDERKTLFAKVGNSDHSVLGTFVATLIRGVVGRFYADTCCPPSRAQ
jgi:hypothetical protein